MIQINSLTKSFGHKTILDNADITLPDTGLVLLEGENGSGKTTLLDIIGLLTDKYDGSYFYYGQDVRKMSEKKKASIRLNDISYIFQKNNLVRYLDKAENISLESLIRTDSISCGDSGNWRCLSQGQQEMIICQSSLKPGKKLYLLDEVTSSLDSANQQSVLARIKELSRQSLVIAVCHDFNLKDNADYIYSIRKGKVSLIKGGSTPIPKNNDYRLPATKRIFHKHLFFSRLKSTILIHIIGTILFSLMLGIGWIGVNATFIDPMPFLKEATDFRQPFIVQANNSVKSEDIMNKFKGDAFIQCSELVAYSSSVPDDGYIHCNKYTYSRFKNELLYGKDTYTISGKEYGFKIDDSIDKNLFFLYDKDNGAFDWNHDFSSYIFWHGIYQNFWDVNGQPGRGAVRQNSNQDFYYIVNQAGIDDFIKDTTIDIELEDDTFYTNKEFLQTSGKTKFDYEPSFYTNKQSETDFNSLFPDGIKVKFLPELSSANSPILALVSPRTLDKIVKHGNIISRKILLLVDESNQSQIQNYLVSNKLFVSFWQEHSSSSLEDYNNAISTMCFITGYYYYGSFIFSMPLFIIIFEMLFVIADKRLQLRDDRILKSRGLSGNSIELMEYGMFITDALISIVLGFALAAIASITSNAKGTLFYPSPFYSCLWVISVLAIYSLAFFLASRIGNKK